jgi:sec-independent protein translocase protein TatA
MGLLGGHGFELIIVLVVALLVFGPKKLPEMGSSIGKSITAFRKGMSEMSQPKDEENTTNVDTQKSIDSSRLELEAIERELAAKKAALAEQEAVQPEPAAE